MRGSDFQNKTMNTPKEPSSKADTDCRKCGAQMPVCNTKTPFGTMTITAWHCQKCGHYNNLKSRKKK